MTGLVRLLSRSSKQESLYEATWQYQHLVHGLHARGIKVHAVTSPLVLHDRPGGHRRVQSALGVPIEGIDWDEISFMVYRVEFQHILGKLNSDIVYAYSKRAARRFRAAAGIDLGEVGHVPFPVPKEGFSDPRDLRSDAAAAKAAGISHLNVYSLDGLRSHSAQLSLWLTPPNATKPRPQLKSRFYIQLLDWFAGLLPRAG